MKKEENKEKKINIFEKIITLRESIEEEFDLIELVEDSIKDVFACDLDCATCSREEQGACMQNFKKANLFWLRKIAQDEWAMKRIVEQINEMSDALKKLMGELVKNVKSKNFENKDDLIIEDFAEESEDEVEEINNAHDRLVEAQKKSRRESPKRITPNFYS